MIKRVIPFTHYLLQEAVQSGDIAIDCTAGNGHDTKLLAELVGSEGKIFAFDIQPEAIEATSKRLNEAGLGKQAELIQSSHADLTAFIPSHLHGKVKAAVFNLGYLPGGDKEVVTSAPSTISAIKQLLNLMARDGVIAIVIYHGHPEGQKEKNAVLEYVQELDQKSVDVLQYQFLNQRNNPPFLIALQKK